MSQLGLDGLARLCDRLPAERMAAIDAATFRAEVLEPLGERARPALEKYMEGIAGKLENPMSAGSMIEVVTGLDDPAYVPQIAWALTAPGLRRRARDWIEAHPTASAVGAVTGWHHTSSKNMRQGYADTLGLAMNVDPEGVQGVLDAYGGEVVAALPDVDLSKRHPSRAVKMPDFWKPDLLPEIRLRSDPDLLLPRELYEDIGRMLKFSASDNVPYIGLIELERIADELSLGDFVWALFEAWAHGGHDPKQMWVVRALELFGGAAMSSGLPKLADDWGSSYHGSALRKRFKEVVLSFRDDTNPFVIEALYHMALSEKAYVRTIALKQLNKVTGLKLDVESVADVYAPTFGVSLYGRITLEPGMALPIHLNEFLELQTPEDITTLEPRLQRRWSRLQALCAQHGAFQATRLERAMRAKRRWDFADWYQRVLSHPLLRLVAQRVLWGSFDGKSVVSVWRVDETCSTVDVEDDAVAPDIDLRVGVIRPEDLEDTQREAWSEILADYEIVQPFDQLGRADA